MNTEHARLRADIAVTERKLQEEVMKAKGHKYVLKSLIEEMFDFTRIDEDKVRMVANEFCDRVAEIRKLTAQLAELKEALNG